MIGNTSPLWVNDGLHGQPLADGQTAVDLQLLLHCCGRERGVWLQVIVAFLYYSVVVHLPTI